MNNLNSKKLNRVSQTSLSGKQSVRTTFKLNENCINDLDWILRTNNLKPKELFDLFSSFGALIDVATKAAKNNDRDLSIKQKRKTFVISKRVLHLLNKKSEKEDVSRDIIIENVVSIFKELLERETKKEREAKSIISAFCGNAEKIEKELGNLLGEDNPILSRFGIIVTITLNLLDAVELKLSNDIPVDPDDFSQN